MFYHKTISIFLFLFLRLHTMFAQPSNPVPGTCVPLQQPVVVIGSQFLAQYPVDLKIATRLLSLGENDFSVTDVNGTLIFKVKSKILSFRDRRHLLDAFGNTIATFQEKLITAHNRWKVYRGESTKEQDLLFSVKKSSMIQFKTELDVFLASNTAESVPDFKVKGSWLERSCTIYLGQSNTLIAQMHKKHTVSTIIFEAENFGVTVYLNVDYAFIVSLVVILDEINDDRLGED